MIQLSAFRNLADEDKNKVLSKSIMQLSQVSIIVSIVLIVVFYFLIINHTGSPTIITSAIFIVLLLLRIIVYMMVRKMMIRDGVAPSYRNKYFLSWLVTTIGVVLFIVFFMMQFNHAAK
jgi:hypothetical protein